MTTLTTAQHLAALVDLTHLEVLANSPNTSRDAVTALLSYNDHVYHSPCAFSGHFFRFLYMAHTLHFTIFSNVLKT